MLFETPEMSESMRLQLKSLDDLRDRLRQQSGGASPWLGSLRRQWRASSAESSIEIEGFNVPVDEQLAIADGDARPATDDEDRMALACHAHAMDHVGVMSEDPNFSWQDRVVLDLHFDACSFQRDKEPGRYRVTGIEAANPHEGAAAFVGPAPEDVAGLMGEVVEWLEDGDLDTHVVVRAAMAHLHVVSVHPFPDGNGRLSRIIQSLVLARGGVLAPEFLSIDEYLGRNTDAYYATLRQVQGGGYRPERDATPWVKFCIEAHIEQANRRLEQATEAGVRWGFLENLVERRRWPDRFAIALEQALVQSVDRAAYSSGANVSTATASNDFRRLLDADLIIQRGKGRSTGYVASSELMHQIRGNRQSQS